MQWQQSAYATVGRGVGEASIIWREEAADGF